MPDSNTYLKEAVERLIQGLTTIADSDGDNIVVSVQPFLLPYPSGSDWAAANPFRLSRQEQPHGRPFISQSWDIPVKIGIGNLNQELGGNQQAKLWERIPTVINWIAEHPTLQFAQATGILAYLDSTVGIQVLPGAIQTRAEEQETGKIIWFDIIVQIPFTVPIKLTMYQDGQLVEVE